MSAECDADAARLYELADLIQELYGLVGKLEVRYPRPAVLRIIRPGIGLVGRVSIRNNRLYSFHDIVTTFPNEMPKVASGLACLMGINDDEHRIAIPSMHDCQPTVGNRTKETRRYTTEKWQRIPMVDGQGPRYVYMIVADDIEDRIGRGELTVGERLPGHMVLAKLYGISKDSARRAMRELRERGAVRTVNRVGSRVIPPHVRLLP